MLEAEKTLITDVLGYEDVKLQDAVLEKANMSLHYASLQGKHATLGKGIPLIVVHGFGGGIGVFFKMIPMLRDHWGGPIHFLDLPGMGSNDRLDENAVPDFEKNPLKVEQYFADAMSEWIDIVIKDPKQRLVIMGHSFGGY